MSYHDDSLFPSLVCSATTAFLDYLQVSEDERSLMIYDKSSAEIADAFKQAAMESGIKLDMRKIEPTGANGADPDPKTCKMMLKYDVVIAATEFSMTHCSATRQAREAGARVGTLPGCTSDIFERGMKVSPFELSASGKKWIALLKGAREIRVLSKAGTDMSFKTGSVPFKNDDGLIHRRGECGNLPAGEVFTAPDAGTGNGKIVIDGSIGSFEWDEYSEPATVIVKDGKAVSFDGVRGKRLQETLGAVGEGGFVFAEFGIGTNPLLRLGGNLLEDEKVRGTIHFAFGNNRGFGGTNDVPIHIDGLVLSPDVFVDGKQLMKAGEWLV
jgi:leucyl aminopeptidase (aminopeptidase T)